jgi:uncharacterized protein YecE (DUF72 family)
MQWKLGTIGFSYKEWVGGFYPPGTSPINYLAYYSKIFNTVEVDTTFHALPRHDVIQSWKASIPINFKFSFKTPHIITHELKLNDSIGLMTEFLDAIQVLNDSLGPILIQMPPNFHFDRIGLLNNFLESLPSTYRYAIELRHPSWYNEQTAQLLSRFHICWVTIDFPNLPRKVIPTTDFLYVRWIGVNGMYQHHSFEREDKNHQLRFWLHEIEAYEPQIPIIYGYFNNDYTGFAAGTCKRFMLMAGLLDPEDNLPYQERLF